LLDLGLHASFDASMTFAEAVMKSINAGHDESSAFANVELVRIRDVDTVAQSITAPAHVLHIIAHTGETTFALDELIDTAGRGVSAGALIADACATATTRWQRAIRDYLYEPVTYIGTTASIGWHSATVFSSMFYGALFRNKGRDRTPQEAAMDAAERAISAYGALIDGKCPFRAVHLEPSRKALRRFRMSGT
jgi:hypothetical protein